MELPDDLKKLYRHWSLHTKQGTGSLKGKPALMNSIRAFVRERMRIWEKKYKGQMPPYTKDSILSLYRFCNMLRELDRQTIEFHTLLAPLRSDFPLWLLNMFYCRMVARPQTVREVGLLSFDAAKNVEFEKRLRALPRPRYGTPYVFPISVIMRSPTPNREAFIAQHLPSVMKHVAKQVEQLESASVSDAVEQILPAFGFNLRFLWTEVLIDVAYQYPERIDLYKAFPVGPGALPTFGRIDSKAPPHLLAEVLGSLGTPSGLTLHGVPITLSAENWEGVGCEYRKYTNLKEGKGRKRTYRA